MLLILLNLIAPYNCGEYNFALLVGQPNTILLSQYTPKEIDAPFYQIQDSNQYNLEIQQSIHPLFNNVFNFSQRIVCASNYVASKFLYSNYFWFLSDQQILYAGVLDSFGNITTEIIDVELQGLVCIYVNLITLSEGILTCLDQLQIIFVNVDSASLQQTFYNTSYYLPQGYSYLKSTINYENENAYSIMTSYITNTYASVVRFRYRPNTIETYSSYNCSGQYYQVEVINFSLFLLNLNSVQYVDLIYFQITSTIQIQNSGNQQTSMAVSDVSNQTLYRIAILDNLQLQIYYFNSQKLTSKKIAINLLIINPYQNLIQFSITFNSIYIITNNYIMKLSGETDIHPQGYMPLHSCNYVMISFERQIIVTQQVLNGQVIFSTFLFNQPQIQISINQTLMIVQNTTQYLLKLLITPQTLQQIKSQISFWIMPQNLTNSICPIAFQHNMSNLYLSFPDPYNIPFTEVFLGPNLTQSITSQNPSILYAETTSNYIKFQVKTNTIVYLELCSIYNSSAIYCSQYNNFTIEISYWNPLLSQQYMQYPATQQMKSCSCFKSKSNVNILIEFNDTIFVQKFNYQIQPEDFWPLTMPVQILSSTILQDTLFIITIDGHLTAQSLKIYGDPIVFTITNYTFNYIYTNVRSYPTFLFIDNKVNLMILQYNGDYYTYEILNTIQYPITDYNQISIGILKTGIYMAIVAQNNNFLYFFPIQNVYITNSGQNYYLVDLLGYEFQTGQIVSSYTSNHFYLILENQVGIYCAYFSGSGSPFNSFVYSNLLFSNSQKEIIQYMSVIQKDEYHIELVQVYTNTSVAINGSVFFGEFQMIPYFLETKYSYMTNVSYLASNQNCSLQLQQRVYVTFDRQFITPKQFNSEIQVLKIQNATKLKINPSSLFNGNIQNYSKYCKECNSFNLTQPISKLTSQTLNFSISAAVKCKDNIFLQNNISVYQLSESSGAYKILYNFPYQNSYCYTIFIDKFTQFPVSICFNQTTFIYAYNLTGNTEIQYNFTNFSNLYKANYRNGVLQVITINYKLQIEKYSYYSFYFWISNNTIYLEQIFNSSNLCTNSFLDFVYLSMSSNYTAQPCQIFGFTSLEKNGFYNPIFYLLNTCISSQTSQQFGFQSNQYAENFNIYFTITTWNLYQTLPIYFKFLFDIQQYQNSKNKTTDIIEQQFIVPLSYSIEIYSILFNINYGNIIGFHKQASLFLSYNSNVSGYFTFQGINGMIINENYVNYTTLTINIYPISQNYEQEQQPIQIIAQEYYTLQTVGSLVYSVVTENYLFITDNDSNQTIAYPIQSWLEIDVDITGLQQSSIYITAQNQQSQSQQSYFLQNEAYQAIPEQKEKQNLGLIIGLSTFLLIVVTLITSFIIRYFRYKQRTRSTLNYFELEKKL
ncbi:unnamed protein product [Paramecium octaurelia]|uniref:Transmembrane protein n=1 Tax=Paramecium octaurelia TaxID=43137 RepID=A0A8S1VQ53_PAROT|nr:unnamed protein product [Paramecium octaurelia]